jgi:hypothetical protein
MRDTDEIRADVDMMVARRPLTGPYEVIARLSADVPDLLAEVVRLRAAASTAKALHGPVVDIERPTEQFCDTCPSPLVPWPCPTIRALAAAEQGETTP